LIKFLKNNVGFFGGAVFKLVDFLEARTFKKFLNNFTTIEALGPTSPYLESANQELYNAYQDRPWKQLVRELFVFLQIG